MNAPTRPSPPETRSEPAWEVARLFPDQGHWSVEEYLNLPTNRLVEFSHGCIEVLPMPTMLHQAMLLFLLDAFRSFLRPEQRGTVMFAGLPVRLWEGKFREPDVVVMLAEHADRIGNRVWDGADLVLEVVSDSNRQHDLETKRREYAQAGIPEYWIVDPLEQLILVLRLEGASYAEHGRFARGAQATSALLPGLAVAVSDVLDARG